MSGTQTKTDIKNAVRERYGKAAAEVAKGDQAGCCGETVSCCGSDVLAENPITSDLYSVDETAELPDAAVLASLGCGNPTALAELLPGQTVLDLGSGGGIDVLLSARRVGTEGIDDRVGRGGRDPGGEDV